jgi:ribonucleoside-diphosphate reductase alpha chain
MNTSMRVQKRDGSIQNVSYDKVLERITKLVGGESGDPRFKFLGSIDVYYLSVEIINNIHDLVSTVELDDFASTLCMDLSIKEPEYSELASRIVISSAHKSLSCLKYITITEILFQKGLLNPKLYSFAKKHSKIIEETLDTFRDYSFDFFGYNTLRKSYLYEVIYDGKKYVETPQHCIMRMSLGIYKDTDDITQALSTYELISKQLFTHATPTWFNSGMVVEQNSSCFLLGTEDTIEGIFKTMSDCALISKWAGGIGMHCSNIRAKGTLIRKTNGLSDGIIPMLKVYNEITKYINQGGKRNGSIAVYLEPHHPDILDFLKIRNNVTDISLACRNLFPALWISDHFMDCVENDREWYLMCPDLCPGLQDVYGEEYKKLYESYVSQGLFSTSLPAREVWNEILKAQSLSGMPYILFKDPSNIKSNQKNIGTIKSSNLCAEILLVSDSNNYAVCNLASVCLTKFIKDGNLDTELLGSVVRQIVRNLDTIIDVNFYSTPESERTNKNNRPMGIGVQGLANLFYELRIPFESDQAKQLNKLIFETIQYNALSESCSLAEKKGTYSTYSGSPSSMGIFQHNMWNVDESELHYDWKDLRLRVLKHGLRNSVVTALMPTASTAQIMGNYESFEPITSNMFIRNTISGTFPVINKYLVRDLKKLGMWSTELSKEIQRKDGSIQDIPQIPEEIRNLYKTVWEIKQKVLIDLAADRAPFIDQTQSMNLYVSNPRESLLTSMYFYCWKKGLKTGVYYLRSKSSSTAIKFTAQEPDCTSCSA